jgi:hypothetical protein
MDRMTRTGEAERPSLFGNWLVHAPSHFLLDHPQLRPHAVAPGFPLE